MGPATADAICDEDYILLEREYYEEKEKDSKYVDPEILEWTRSGWDNPRKINLPKFNFNKKRNLNIRNNLPRKFKPFTL